MCYLVSICRVYVEDSFVHEVFIQNKLSASSNDPGAAKVIALDTLGSENGSLNIALLQRIHKTEML